MRKNRLRLKHCGKITAVVILLNFLMTFPLFAEQPMEPPQSSSVKGTRLYSDFEVDILIEDLSRAAFEAIEKAAGEAAKAAVLAVVEREAAAIHEAQYWKLETEKQKETVKDIKKAGTKNAVITGLACLLGGLAVGVGGTLIIGGNR